MASTHIIQRASIDLQLPGIEQAEAGAVREWCVSVLLEELDVVLSEICPEHQMIVMPTLTLDLTLPVWNELLRPDQKNVLRQQIRQQMAEQTPAVRMPLDQHRAEIVLRYLSEGSLDEMYAEPEWDELKAAFRQVSQQNRLFQQRLLRALMDESAFQRWLSLTDEAFRYVWLDTQLPESAGSWRDILTQLHDVLVFHWPEHPMSVRQMLQILIRLMAQGIGEPKQLVRTVVETEFPVEKVWTTTLVTAINQRTSGPIAQWLVNVLSAATPWPGQTVASESTVSSDLAEASKPQSPPADQRVAVSAAGLVLVAHFLPAFLRAIGLVDADNKLINSWRIPMLLYFMATGETQADEWQLVLPKILCGLPIAESCDTSIDVSEGEQQEVNKLLTDVIEHWGRLKTTSPDGLRATFLQRAGRLTEKEAMFALAIPEETVDILLSFIPWSFRYVRFSWMKKLLITEWGG
ncbi:contractile injection system tape measure protein [Spirosoma sp. KNUC1025]|uniref:contractile injection system tape measure protein n=1 Tax=Spirosoma sp. KNUC1025 TaxID=2894082 RepID=UPI003865CF53|nr:hypothetical protein LN737_06875 [Spirosoma sp. KNUC1025]